MVLKGEDVAGIIIREGEALHEARNYTFGFHAFGKAGEKQLMSTGAFCRLEVLDTRVLRVPQQSICRNREWVL